MATTLNCPGCKGPLRLRNDMAGKTIKCPRCGQTIALPAEGAMRGPDTSAARAMAAEPPVSRDRIIDITARLCPECGALLEGSARRCDSCKAPVYKPCPRCGEEGAKRVAWTPWGSYYGPAVFAHVRCPVCYCTYNGRSGRSNFIPAIIFVAVPLLLILLILGALGWVSYHQAFK